MVASVYIVLVYFLKSQIHILSQRLSNLLLGCAHALGLLCIVVFSVLNWILCRLELLLELILTFIEHRYLEYENYKLSIIIIYFLSECYLC